jgi:hypothetical protein
VLSASRANMLSFTNALSGIRNFCQYFESFRSNSAFTDRPNNAESTMWLSFLFPAQASLKICARRAL